MTEKATVAKSMWDLIRQGEKNRAAKSAGAIFPPAPGGWVPAPKSGVVAGWPTIPRANPAFPSPSPWDARPAPWAPPPLKSDELIEALTGAKAKAAADAERLAQQGAQAAAFAKGVEESSTAMGARHHLRLALGAGHALGLARCWAAVVDRGMQGDTLEKGRSETLMAAALGASPAASLAWLAKQGFAPGAQLASLALLALLAARPGKAGGLAELVGMFRAGSLEASTLGGLERLEKGLGEAARANGEAFEIAPEAGPAKPAAPAPRL